MSEVNEAHVYISHYGDFGFAISSPQLPALAGGTGSLEELQEHLFDDAVSAGLSPGGTIVEHFQYVLASERGDEAFFVRCRQDFHIDGRSSLAQIILNMIAQDEDLRGYIQRDEAGDGTVVACLAEDSLSTVLASLEPGEPTTLALMSEDGLSVDYLGLLATPTDVEPFLRLSSLGLPPDATVGSLMAAIPSGREGNEKSHARERELVLI